jgi:hypothetical protein
LKWIKDININPETLKLLEENIRRELLDLRLGKDFFGYDSKSIATKAKIGKWDCIKLKSLYSKGNNQQYEETAHTMGENICNFYT